ncbi:protein-glutamate methylesterase/protein-glutamine glutaminase [Spirochaeta isovalerica]|uniref:Protein-glutamate methylesterase/protein-glutamine glutaminase n=1 Tax=Spirochaeta isovalerica TaxID=150 RepID=A0A841RFB7_9SPIO|nr:chemotaxis response regulator protein-glutamate methylesterase [Spirochaeta isovalerica]MBB6482296.1 two-component system chemotaxis response regulator CheB [Spirochaeta isovalerica]
MTEDPISVLIVDDSAMMRNLIGRIVESHEGLTIAGKAMNGMFALQKMPRLDPDVIVLDIEMPEMNGIEFLKEKNKLGNTIPVIVLSAVATKGAKVTMEAISLGASDFITKPSGTVSHDIQSVGSRLVELLLVYGRDYRKRTGPRKKPDSVVAPVRRPIVPPVRNDQKTTVKPSVPIGTSHWEKITPLREPGKIQIMAIGISTGGPNALRKVFADFDPGLAVPVVVVQHMPAGFTEEFAKSLDRICPLEVKEAADGDLLKAGRILIAPGDFHIQVSRKSLGAIVNVISKDPVNGHRPSVDVLFESVAKEYQNESIAAIMTGMGKDGAREIGQIYKEGGITLAQDEETSIVYGMPKVAVEHGYISEVVPLHNMAERLCSLTREHS